jgi:hypothetical protein
MRAIRALVTVLTIALIGLVPVAASASTGASSAGEAVQARAAAKAAPSVGAKIVKKKGKLFMIGNVKPPKGKVTIQKATKCNKKTGKCNFKRYARVPVKNGRYKVRVPAPKRGYWYWRAVKGSAKSSIWRTYTI